MGRPRNPRNSDLPPGMVRRRRPRKDGTEWIGFYYVARWSDGTRTEIPLGTDLNQAKQEWARLEKSKIPPPPSELMGGLFDRYEREIIPTKRPRTQQDNRAELRQLRKAFQNAPITAITPQVVAQYRDARTAKTRGNREIALLSHIFTIAREWGVLEGENPCARVRRNKEQPRRFYADDAVWSAVYAEAVQELRDAMDLAYLTGQRPGDTIGATTADITEQYFLVEQSKTGKRLRIRLFNDQGEPNGLHAFLDGLIERRKFTGITTSRLITNESGLRMSYGMLRNRWDEARQRAARKVEAVDEAMAARIREFRFMDIRPKAATDIEDIGDASKLLSHSKEQTTMTIYRRVGEIAKPTK